MKLWSGYRNTDDLQREFERFFDHLGRGKRPTGVFGTGTWAPSIDVYETAEKVVVLAELAGVREEDVEVWVDKNVLVIRGVRRDPRRGQRLTYHLMEVQYGPFERAVWLPTLVDADNATATCQAGFLEIVFAKAAEEPRSKKITIVVP